MSRWAAESRLAVTRSPLKLDGFQVVDEDATIVNCRERCLSDGADYQCNIPGSAGLKGIEIVTRVVEQTRGDWNGDIARQLPPRSLA